MTVWFVGVCFAFGVLSIGLAVYELWKFAKEMADLDEVER